MAGAANVFMQRLAVRLPHYRELTKISIKNTRCLQCALNSYQSLVTYKFFTHAAPKDSMGYKKNVRLENLVICHPRCSSTKANPNNPFNLSEDSCPQGVQGDDCTTFKLWMQNCQRYGLQNCNDQLQGIQSGRKTLAEVLAEQEKLIEEIAEQYRAAHAQNVGQDSSHLSNVMSDRDSIQGCQENVSAFPEIDTPCPQGIQGSDCARFKLWLENCHRFGFDNCMDQYRGYKDGRKTLAEIFQEQDKMIREAAASVMSRNAKNKRSYSTLAGPDKTKESETD